MIVDGENAEDFVENEKFLKTGGGFNLVFDKNSAEISEDIKNQIQFDIEERDLAGINTLEIISYTHDENGDLMLSQNRLNAVLIPLVSIHLFDKEDNLYNPLLG